MSVAETVKILVKAPYAPPVFFPLKQLHESRKELSLDHRFGIRCVSSLPLHVGIRSSEFGFKIRGQAG